MNQKDLAAKVGCVPPAISMMLGPNSKESSLKPGVHKALGWPPPTSAGMPIASVDAGELSHIINELPVAKRLAVLTLTKGELANLPLEIQLAILTLLRPANGDQ